MKILLPTSSTPSAVAPRTPVKRAALAAFRAVRRVTSKVTAVPGHVRRAGRDVVDAWHESARS